LRVIPSAMDRPQISVVIPLFNEEENVRALLEELFAELAKLGRSFEVHVVNQTQIHDIDRNLRIVALLQGA